MKDLNTKVEIDNAGYKDIVRPHELEEGNENSGRFPLKMVINDTMFPQKYIHKSAWVPPDHTRTYEIYHMCINKEFRRFMKDVRTERGVDHYLIVPKMKLKL